MRRFVLVVLCALLAACEGGGGQLSEGQGAVPTSAPNASIASSGAPEPIPTEELDGPDTLKETIRILKRAEIAIRAEGAEAVELRRLGRQQQLAYRALAAHPKWVSKVLDRLPAALRPAVQATHDAGAAISGVTGEAPAGFPEWEILEPEPAAQLLAHYQEGEQQFGVSWAYLASIHFVETRMGRIHGLSSAGAQGPMQFIPSTWAEYGEGDINDDRDAIIAAARYLNANNAATDIDNALFRYNNDDRYVAAIKGYAQVMLADPDAYFGFYHWQVFYATVEGAFLLPEGWSAG
jgi:hypothetical protein